MRMAFFVPFSHLRHGQVGRQPVARLAAWRRETMRMINFFFYRVQNFEKIKEIARAIMIIIIQNAMLPGPVQMIESDGITLGVSPFLTRMGAKIGGDDVDNRPDVSCISVFDHIRSTIGKVNLKNGPR